MNTLSLIGLLGIIVVSNRAAPVAHDSLPAQETGPENKKHTRHGIGLGIMAFASMVLCTGSLLSDIPVVLKVFVVFAMTVLIVSLLYAVAATRHRDSN
ncbi:hypothetical protein [Prescottella subtropica]|uniref:hypothetical protein n=1 Tax=Prescottella subtropica TaxID=2545757 RepID=UPI0010F9B3B8|nr:hypothetical protein [Prescottella subtropica]